MAQPNPPTAEKSSHGNQTYFLSQKRRHGAQNTDPPMGHHAIEHAVFFFEDRPMGDEHSVALSLKNGGFALQEYLSVHEARTLAQALNMAADHASGVGFGTEAAAMQARAQAGLLAAALDGNAVRFAFFSGQLSFARSLTNGTGKRLAAKDAARAASGDHAQTHLERAWTALPVGAEKLTMAQVQQLLAAQGIKVGSDSSVLDQAPGQPLQACAVSLPVGLAGGGQATVAVEVYALGRGVSLAGQGGDLLGRQGAFELEANGQRFIFDPLGAAHTHRFVSAVEGDVAPIWQMVQAVNQKDHAELGNGVSAGAVGHVGTPLKTAILSLPQGMGKTTMAHQVARWLGCTAIVDEWNPGLAVLPGALHLTSYALKVTA